MRGSARSGRSPQPSPPASTSPSSPSSSLHASIRRARFLRGSIVPSPRMAGPPRSAAGPSGPRPSCEPRRRVDDPLRRDAERLGQVGRGEAGVREDDVAGRRRVPALVRVHRDGASGAPLRVVERHEVVEHGRAHASALRRVHPLAEDEGVQTSREQLHRRPAEPAPSGTERVRGGQRDEPARGRDAVERSAGSRAARAGSSARTRRARAVLRRPRTCRRASRGCSSRSRCADGRAARRRRRSSYPLPAPAQPAPPLSEPPSSLRLMPAPPARTSRNAPPARGRPCCPGSPRRGRASARR